MCSAWTKLLQPNVIHQNDHLSEALRWMTILLNPCAQLHYGSQGVTCMLPHNWLVPDIYRQIANAKMLDWQENCIMSILVTSRTH